MQVLVTGATGAIGHAIVCRLVERGDRIRALVRDARRARRLLPASVMLCEGDITDPGSLPAAVRDVEVLFHAAGLPEGWQSDEDIFERVNVQGVANVLDAALGAGIRRVVYTSTMDVFAAPPGGTVVEAVPDRNPRETIYERSKQAAERVVDERLDRGLDVVVLNPAAVYGPSPTRTGLNGMISRLVRGAVPVMPPGGLSVAYTEAVAQAHVCAAETARAGERYLLADEYVPMRRLAHVVARITGRRPPPSAPAALVRLVAAVSAPLARRLGFTPLLAPGELHYLLWQARVDATKAQQQLGYQPVPFEEGVRRTIASVAA